MKQYKAAIYISGGIAAYKVTQLVRTLVKKKIQVRVAMTKNAQKFITPLTMSTLSKHYVLTDLKSAQLHNDFIPHITLAEWCDFAIVVPATANVIAKLAHGIADDMVTTSLLAITKPKFIVPAMNDKMWYAPVVQRNLKQLTVDGYHILEPVTGELAEGHKGKGRMPAVGQIMEWLQHFTAPSLLKGQRILITAGGTQEPIDPVRYIGNHSSGKMGIALAKTAAQMGAKVTLIIGQTSETLPSNIKVIPIKTFTELAQNLKVELQYNDVLIMAAAVSDYHVAHVASNKIKSTSAKLTLKLVKNPNLLKMIAAQKHHQLLVGFAAETRDLLTNAQNELRDKKVDMLVANDVARSDIGFGNDENEVYLLTKNAPVQKISKTSKQTVAIHILEKVAQLLTLKEEENSDQ